MKNIIILFILINSCGYSIDVSLSWEKYLPPPKTQHCSDCYIYASTTALEMQLRIDYDLEVDLSEQDIHNCMGYSCSDLSCSRYITDYLKEYGAIEEEYVKTNEWKECYSGGATRYKIKSWRKIKRTKNEIANALKNGPVIIEAIKWFKFEEVDKKLYCVKSSSGMTHDTVIVGYEDYGNIMLIRNSFGEDFLFRVSYEDLKLCGLNVVVQMYNPIIEL